MYTRQHFSELISLPLSRVNLKFISIRPPFSGYKLITPDVPFRSLYFIRLRFVFVFMDISFALWFFITDVTGFKDKMVVV